MDFSLFVVTTLLSVHVYADFQRENLTLAGFNATTTILQESVTKSFDNNIAQKGTVTKHSSTTESVNVTVLNDKTGIDDVTTQSFAEKESTMMVAETTAVHDETENVLDVTTSKTEHTPETVTSTNNPDIEINSLPTKTASKTTQVPDIFRDSTLFADEVTHSLPTHKHLPNTLSTEKVTKTDSESHKHLSDTILHTEITTKIYLPEHPETLNKVNQTETGKRNESNEYIGTTDMKNGKKVLEDLDSKMSNAFDPDKMPPREFLEWLDSIHPDANVTKSATVTVKNIIDTSIISTEKLIIVISTICGTFVLFVVILIAISCCRRNRNIRNDSEKSDFSVTSVVSVPDKRKSDLFTTDKNGFNNLFMGIPANNEVWKNLEHLSPADSSVMPESTKM